MDETRIVIAHGGGGIVARELLDGVILPALGDVPDALPDAAAVPGTQDLVITTDAFVVKPLFFQGGDIGSLSVHGTVNDLAVSGAEPLALSLSLVLEEGLAIATLKRALRSAGRAARDAGVAIVTGDTKVVPRGEADQLFITTAGVGRRRIDVAPGTIEAGDTVIINGPIAEHGIAVMSARKGIAFETPVCSDSASVWPLVEALVDAGIEVHAMRDPTRGGVAATCVELADESGVSVVLDEAAIPLSSVVAGACEMLGLDPLSVANEGKLVVFAPEGQAKAAVEILRGMPGGEQTAVVGQAVARREKSAYLRTRYGGERIIEMPYGEELPRIC